MRGGRGPKTAVPTRTMVPPSSTATSKSPLIPIDRSARPCRSASLRSARLVPRAAQAGGAARPGRPVDGDERRLRGGRRGGGHHGARGHRGLRAAPAAHSGPVGGALPARGPRVSVKGKKVGFVGAGNMGEALIRGLVESNLVPADTILVADVRADRVRQLADQYGLRAVSGNAALVGEADVVVLAVKPQIMAPVLR